MKKLFFLSFILSLLISCSKEETDPYKEFWGYHVKDTTGLRVLNKFQTTYPPSSNGEISIQASAYWESTEEIFKPFFSKTKEKMTNVAYLFGLRHNKLWIGEFDVITLEQLHEWMSEEDFPTRRSIDLGYGEVKEYDFNLRRSTFQVVIQDDNNIAVLATSEGNSENNDFYFAHQNNISICTDKPNVYHIGEWDTGYIVFYNHPPYSLYNNQGEFLYEATGGIFNCYPVNMEEAIKILDKQTLFRYNLKTGETIWEVNLKLDNIPSDARLESKFTSKESNIWTYTIDITYYSGEKDTRQFKINIDNGEITYL